jgi:hypothetical protein
VGGITFVEGGAHSAPRTGGGGLLGGVPAARRPVTVASATRCANGETGLGGGRY